MKKSLSIIFAVLLAFAGYGQVTEQGLAGYYPLNGNASDFSSFALNGQISGATSTTNRFGTSGAALQFDGTNDYVEIPDADQQSIATTGELTVSVWMRPDALNYRNDEGDGYIHWLGKGNGVGTSGQQEYHLRIYNENHPDRSNRTSCYVFNLSGGLGSGSYVQEPIQIGEWIHIVAVYDYPNNLMRIYKNGQLRDTDFFTDYNVTPENGTAPFRIGTRDFNSFFEGALDDVRIYNRVLTQGEITELYEEEEPENGTVFCLGFEDFNDEEEIERGSLQSLGLTVPWVNGFDQSRCFADNAVSHLGENSLRVLYSANAFGTSNGGAQAPITLPAQQEYYMSYWVRFSDNFDWGGSSEGGKLPGLSGTGACSGCSTCNGSNGFSARFMWRQGGRAVLYLYHMDKSGSCGEDHQLTINGGEDVVFEKGEWYQIVERVRINTGSNRDGEVDVWVNGVPALSLDNLQFVGNGDLIDVFYFSTFHGGSNSNWAPSVDCYTWFDDICVSTNRADVLSESCLPLDFTTTPVESHPSSFKLSFELTTVGNDFEDGVVGLSDVSNPVAYSDLGVAIQLLDGQIRVRNGATYTSDVSMFYELDSTYSFELEVDESNETYSVYVISDDIRTALAEDYQFRSDYTGGTPFSSLVLKTRTGCLDVANLQMDDIVLSTTNSAATEGIRIFPNPVSSGNLIIESTVTLSKVLLTDLSGRNIKEEAPKQANLNGITLNVQDLKKGVYLLLVQYGSHLKQEIIRID